MDPVPQRRQAVEEIQRWGRSRSSSKFDACSTRFDESGWAGVTESLRLPRMTRGGSSAEPNKCINSCPPVGTGNGLMGSVVSGIVGGSGERETSWSSVLARRRTISDLGMLDRQDVMILGLPWEESMNEKEGWVLANGVP